MRRLGRILLFGLWGPGLLSAQEKAASPPTLQHGAPVSGLAFSPSGDVLASAGGDTIHLWKKDQAKPWQTWRTPGSPLSVIAFSADGAYLASGHQDRKVRLWHVARGEEKWAQEAQRSGIGTLAFAPDGLSLVTGGADSRVHQWDVATGKMLRVFQRGSEFWLGTAAFSPDGRQLFAGGYDGATKLFDVVTGREIRAFGGAMFSAMALSASAKTLAVSTTGEGRPFRAGGRQAIRLYEVRTGQVRKELGQHGPADFLVVFSPDGRSVAGRARDEGVIHLWDIASGQLLASFAGGGGGTFAFSADGLRLAQARADNIVLQDLRPALAKRPGGRALSDAERDKLWDALSQTDAQAAFAAVLALAGDAEPSVAFLRKRIRPAHLPPDKRKQATELIRQLHASSFSMREKAQADLAALGDAIAPLLSAALKDPDLPLEARRRVERLLTRLAPAALTPSRLQALRGMEALHWIATPSARSQLEDLADGLPEHWITEEAQLLRRTLPRRP
ncbi:MAG: WD40 repeat domain-containing protein [Gemmataceae bacterium]